jgi:Flp pilus assembly protein TadG
VRGQAAVEFILVFPLFLFLLIAIIEFAFAFSTLNALSFAARDVARVGVEGGDRQGTDCSMLQGLEGTFGATSDRSGIAQVEIFWSDDAGNVLHGARNVYLRGGSLSCTTVKGDSVTLPYTLQAGSTYPENQRCTVLAGCDALTPAHPGVDTLGVRITYDYRWKTPLAGLLQMAPALTFQADQQMRIEPVL